MLLNRDRAIQVMEKHGLDAIVAAFPENIYYLSDYWGPMFLMSRNYTLYAVLPRNPEAPAALIMPGSGVYHLEQTPTWMPNVQGYVTRLRPGAKLPPRDYEFSTEEIEEALALPPDTPAMPYPTRDGPLSARDLQLQARYDRHRGKLEPTALYALRRAMREAGVEAGKIGFDDPRVLAWLQAVGCTQMTGTDALNIFKEIRMVKTAPEIAILRQAAKMSEHAIGAVIESMQIGMPLEDIGLVHMRAMAAQGGRSEWIIANLRGLNTGEVEPNELIKLDSVGSYKQYRGDVGRTVIFGEPTQEMLDRNRAVMFAMEVAYDAIRPGKSFGEIVELTLGAVHKAGFPGFLIAGPHAVGLEHTDHPTSVGPEMPGTHPMYFEENMVFTLDMPYHEFGWGTMHVEDMMVVRKNGCESLSSGDVSLRVRPI
jgi:Xaa-Pro aminopeptidase